MSAMKVWRVVYQDDWRLSIHRVTESDLPLPSPGIVTITYDDGCVIAFDIEADSLDDVLQQAPDVLRSSFVQAMT